MSKQLLLGDEAIAQAALDAGLSGVYAYPGTPSTEITEYIQSMPITAERNIHNRWCSNEKTAMEAALGMSFAGKRSLVCMKHVGMNVAADCFINSAITGVRGGMIVVAADDPSMHSSQNEQDSRFYGDFSLIPMYEPSNQQEAYDMTYSGFAFSEQTGEPILMRMVTRLAHSRSGVERKEQQTQNELSFGNDPRQFILLPGNARKRYKALLERQEEFIKASEESPYNRYTDGPNKKLGIVACGIGYNYLMENYPEGCEYPVLKIGQYPLPKKQLMKLVETCDEILVLEDGQPFVERLIKGYLGIGVKVKGRLDGTLSQDGELNPDKVARAVGKENKAQFGVPSLVEMRPPALCDGCGHRDMYTVLTQVLKEEYPTHKVFRRHQLVRRHGSFHHHGQGCFGRRSASGRSCHRRLYLHPLGHDRPAGLRERECQRDDCHLGQRDNRHDGRTGFGRNRTPRGHLCRHRRSPRTYPCGSPAEKEL